uniref:Uncharacterized protein n=1 Tax=Anguilla anguilla TaxID=7936 RepID=A0A0E9STC8_ANGAN
MFLDCVRELEYPVEIHVDTVGFFPCLI